MPKQTIAHYHQYADHFQAQYDSVNAQDVHADWADLLAEQTLGLALDVGAGSGRDAHWLAQLAAPHGLKLQSLTDSASADFLKRSEVSWQTVCIRRLP